MKISYNWLKEILGPEFNTPPEELSEKLLHLGFEVSSVRIFQKCEGVAAAKILEISKHPNADRLQLAKVTDEKETATVVCGAPNIAVGQKVFWAKVGAKLAGGEEIRETAIRGVKSPGMLCSLKELGISEEHSGIWILSEETPLGVSIDDLVRLDEVILDVEVTPNRPDALSLTGIAREIAAAMNIKPIPDIKSDLPSANASLTGYSVEIQERSGGLHYIARKYENVSIAPSPLKIQAFLIRSGIRPINNVVDITNLVMLETGQPLHAFDADKLEGGKIIVRRAKEGESILALDGTTYSLNPDILVISDAAKPAAIAGIMGGEETAVTNQTKNVLLESAIFERGIIRRARMHLGLASESSYRFERGVSRWSCLTGSSRAGEMIAKQAHGRITAFNHVAVPADQSAYISTVLQPSSTVIRLSQVEKVLGEKSSPSEIAIIFQKLGIVILSSDQEKFLVQNPDWRLDLNMEIDYIEEIARLKGYEKISSAGRRIQLIPSQKRNSVGAAKRKIRSVMQTAGFFEARNYGLVSKKEALLFLAEDAIINIENPLSEDQSAMRPALTLELLKNLRQNLSYQKKEIRLYEMGTIFRKLNGQYVEKPSLAGAACGKIFQTSWQYKESPSIDFFWMKGVIEKILEAGNISGVRFDRLSSRAISETTDILHPAYALHITAGKGGEKIGSFGLVHPDIAKKFDITAESVIFEMDLEKVIQETAPDRKVAQILRTPFIERDCSIWIEESAEWNDILSEIEKSGGKIVEKCRLFDIYSDKEHPNLKSLSFTLTLRQPETTLKDETANETRDKIINHLKKKFKAELRTK